MRRPTLLILLLALAGLALAGCGSTTTSTPGDRDAGGNAADTGSTSPDATVVPGDDAGTQTGDDAGTQTGDDAAVVPGDDAAVVPGDDAGTVTPGGPDSAGAYVVTRTSTMRTDATVVAYVPTLPSGERAPLVVFKHGFQLSSTSYATTLERIATHGFVVLAVDTRSSLIGGPTNIDERDAMIHAIDWALSDAPFASSVDGAHIAVMGHSRGGKDAVLAAAADTRVTAALLLDPVNGCGPGSPYSATCPDARVSAAALTIPVGVMGETNDGSGGFMPCAPLAQNYATIYEAITGSSWAVEWTFADAVHMTFTDNGGGSAGTFCAREPANVETLRADIRAMSVAFLRYHLRGETGMSAWLTGSSVPSGVTTVGP